jgi:uncharacterized protein (DUF58 family)
MAIVVEERGQGTGLVSVLIWLLLLAVVALGFYFVFFKKPELIDIARPPGYETVEQISRISLDPESVVQNPKFRALKAHLTPSEAQTSGRTNPFMSF